MISNLCGAMTGARTVGKRVILRVVSGTCYQTDCVVGSRGRGLGATASVGTGFDGKVSRSRSGVLPRDPILKREPQGETMAR